MLRLLVLGVIALPWHATTAYAQLPIRIHYEIIEDAFDTTGLVKFYGKGSATTNAGLNSLLARWQSFKIALNSAAIQAGVDISSSTQHLTVADSDSIRRPLKDDIRLYASGRPKLLRKDIRYHLQDEGRLLTCTLYAWIDTSDARWRREQERERRHLVAQVTQLHAAAASDKLHIHAIETTAAKLRTHLQNQREETISLHLQIGGLARARIELRAQLRDAEEAGDRLRRTLAERERTIGSLRTMNDSLTAAHMVLHAQLTGVRDSLATLQEESGRRIAALETQLVDQGQQLAQARGRTQDLERALREVESLVVGLRAQNASQEDQIATLQKEMGQLRRVHHQETNSLNRDLVAREQDITRLQEQFGFLQRDAEFAGIPTPAEVRSSTVPRADNSDTPSRTQTPASASPQPRHSSSTLAAELARDTQTVALWALSLPRQLLARARWPQSLAGIAALVYLLALMPPILRCWQHGLRLRAILLFAIVSPNTTTTGDLINRPTSLSLFFSLLIRFCLVLLLCPVILRYMTYTWLEWCADRDKDDGAFNDAIEKYRTAIRMFPKRTWARHSVADVLEKLGDLGGAIEEYQQCINMDPHDVLAYQRIARCLDERVRRSEDSLQPININSADAARNDRDKKEALRQLQTCAHINPHSLEAHTALADHLLDIGRKEEAIREYKSCIQVAPGNAGAYSSLGAIYRQQGDFAEAILWFQQALYRETTWRVAWCHRDLGECLEKCGRLTESIKHYQKCIAFKDADLSYLRHYSHVGLTRVFRRRAHVGDFEQAIHHGRECARSKAGERSKYDDPYLHHDLELAQDIERLGVLLDESGDILEAINIFRERDLLLDTEKKRSRFREMPAPFEDLTESVMKEIRSSLALV